jgi:hypothetical protein
MLHTMSVIYVFLSDIYKKSGPFPVLLRESTLNAPLSQENQVNMPQNQRLKNAN